jgi:hypothetical protein
MTLKNDIELTNTREKLGELEDRYEARLRETPANPHAHELTLQSLRRTINQMKEEIMLYEIRSGRRSFQRLPAP